ncbi:MAG: hypothetical protein CSA66_00545 [Proteobacteria bacterium]|nr:MAG: hypothetical protein CSA66_00545 [Pseudomonadota bacterium]
MSTWDALFNAAFPPPPPWKPYSWKKFKVEMKPGTFEPSPLNPPPPGSLKPWTRSRGVATPGVRNGLAPIEVTTMKLVRTYRPMPILAMAALFPAIQVVKRSLVVSDFDPNAPGTPATGAVNGRRKFDPVGDFNFVVEISDLAAGAFQKVDGLEVQIDTIEYRDSLDPHPHKRPGIHRYGNIKLTKGIIENTALWDWCTEIMAGKMTRRNGTIHVLNDRGDDKSPEASYDFFQAWPCKWSGLRVDGKGGGTLVEELELAIDFFKKK